MIDLETLKGVLGIESDEYDTQFQIALDFHEGEYDDNDINKFMAVCCFLERISPEIVAQVSSYSLGSVSESFNIPSGYSFCETLDHIKQEKFSFGLASGARQGCSKEFFK